MNHVRIATYDVAHGASKAVAEIVPSPDALLEIFRAQPGLARISNLVAVAMFWDGVGAR